ncbi:MAG: thiol:disulfide interchange protein DsbA/DsbL [Aquisalimonadaceae bacterium]
MRSILAAAIVALLLSGSAFAQEYRAGVHYRVLDKPQRTQTEDRIEVREFFSYACPHCYSFFPHVRDMENRMGDDVEIVHNPVIFNQNWVPLARAYMTADALGVVDQVHGAIFVAYHDERKRLGTEDEFAALFAAQGVDEKAFREAWNSFAVDTGMRRADRAARDFGVASTPTMAVNGKYVIDVRTSGGQENMIRIIEHLVEKERQAAQ